MALGKSVYEVRNSMSYQEFKSWQMFYLLEPWGWHDREYRTAALLAMLVNVNTGKKSNRKSEKDYMRDMPKLIDRAYSKSQSEASMRERLLEANIEERKRMIAQAFGAMGLKVKEA